MFSREKKYNYSFDAIHSFLDYVSAKPETLFAYQLEQQKNVIRWDYITKNGSVKSSLVYVKASTYSSWGMTVNYEGKLMAFDVAREIKEQKLYFDYAAYFNVKSRICTLIPTLPLKRLLSTYSSKDFETRIFKSNGSTGHVNTLAIVPLSFIKDRVPNCIERRIP